jgi:DNA-binding CsgD family transcriptional regulator
MSFDAGALDGHEKAASRPSDTNAAMTYENPIVRGLVAISSVSAPENALPNFNNTLLETFAKVHLPALAAVKQVKASATLGNASTLISMAGGLRLLNGRPLSLQAGYLPLGTPVQQGAHLQSVYGAMSAKTAIEHAVGAPYATFQTALGSLVERLLAPMRQMAIAFSEWIDKLMAGWRRRLSGAFEWLRELIRQWPRDPYGELVPVWNVRLYRLAQAAYRGNYVARARFLNEIGADESADNVLFIQDLLQPTFDPNRLDRRDAWEQRKPSDARRWLRKRLSEHRNGGKDKHELPYEENPDEENPGRALITPSMSAELMNPDGAWDREPTYVNGATPSAMAEFMKQERERSRLRQLQAMLPERQYQVLLCLADGMIYEEIAYHLGIGVSTVKTHVRYLRQKHDLKALLSS